MSLSSFANFLINRPLIILVTVMVFSGTCLIIPFILKSFPDFTDPQMVRLSTVVNYLSCV